MQASNPPIPSSIPTPAAGAGAAPGRRERRWRHNAPCILRVLGSGRGEELTLRGRTVNMSVNGFAVQVPEPLPTGVQVEAVIARSADDEGLLLRGSVIHSRRMLAGLFEVGVSIRNSAGVEG